MNSYVMIVFFLFLFVLPCASSLPPSHEFRARTHEGSKTIVQDGVKKKISVERVFWSLVEGDSVYGKRENGRYQSFCKVLFDFSMAPQYMYLNYVNYFVTREEGHNNTALEIFIVDKYRMQLCPEPPATMRIPRLYY